MRALAFIWALTTLYLWGWLSLICNSIYLFTFFFMAHTLILYPHNLSMIKHHRILFMLHLFFLKFQKLALTLAFHQPMNLLFLFLIVH